MGNKSLTAVDRSSSILDRASSQTNSPLTEAQALTDQLVSVSIQEGTNLKTAAAMLGAGWVGRATRIGALTSLPAQTFARGASYVPALAAESAAFAGIERGFHPSSQPFQKDWARAAVTLTGLKAFGGISRGQNIVLQHLFTDLGLVGGHHAAHAVNLMDKPQGSFAQQMLQAEATNWHMKGSMAFAHSLSPRFLATERSLDLYLKGQETNLFSQGRPSPIFSQLATEGGPESFLAESIKSEGAKGPDVLQMSSSENNGDSGKKNGWPSPMEGSTREVGAGDPLNIETLAASAKTDSSAVRALRSLIIQQNSVRAVQALVEAAKTNPIDAIWGLQDLNPNGNEAERAACEAQKTIDVAPLVKAIKTDSEGGVYWLRNLKEAGNAAAKEAVETFDVTEMAEKAKTDGENYLALRILASSGNEAAKKHLEPTGILENEEGIFENSKRVPLSPLKVRINALNTHYSRNDFFIADAEEIPSQDGPRRVKLRLVGNLNDPFGARRDPIILADFFLTLTEEEALSSVYVRKGAGGELVPSTEYRFTLEKLESSTPDSGGGSGGGSERLRLSEQDTTELISRAKEGEADAFQRLSKAAEEDPHVADDLYAFAAGGNKAVLKLIAQEAVNTRWANHVLRNLATDHVEGALDALTEAAKTSAWSRGALFSLAYEGHEAARAKLTELAETSADAARFLSFLKRQNVSQRIVREIVLDKWRRLIGSDGLSGEDAAALARVEGLYESRAGRHSPELPARPVNLEGLSGADLEALESLKGLYESRGASSEGGHLKPQEIADLLNSSARSNERARNILPLLNAQARATGREELPDPGFIKRHPTVDTAEALSWQTIDFQTRLRTLAGNEVEGTVEEVRQMASEGSVPAKVVLTFVEMAREKVQTGEISKVTPESFLEELYQKMPDAEKILPREQYLAALGIRPFELTEPTTLNFKVPSWQKLKNFFGDDLPTISFRGDSEPLSPAEWHHHDLYQYWTGAEVRGSKDFLPSLSPANQLDQHFTGASREAGAPLPSRSDAERKLASHDPELRISALHDLTLLVDPAAIPALEMALQNEKDPRVEALIRGVLFLHSLEKKDD